MNNKTWHTAKEILGVKHVLLSEEKVEEALDDIRHASALGRSEAAPSVADSLVAMNLCTPRQLAEAYRLLGSGGVENAIAFFQLPFRMRIPENDKWFSLRREVGP